MRRIGFALLAVLALAAVPACSKQDDHREDLERIIDRTAPLAHRFIYTYETQSRAVSVRGIIEDDFRYKARISLDGEDVLDEVVADDALAVRFLDPSLLPNFVTQAAEEPIGLEALAAQRWVLDADGAPSVGLNAVEEEGRGADPIVDALTVLDYVKLTIADADKVRLYNDESIEYRAEEDPFPTPEEGTGIDRYDIVPKDFPIADAKDANGEAILPTIAHFRKVSVYVRDGVIIQIRERVAAEGRALKDLETFVDRLVRTQGPRIVDEYEAGLAQLEGDDRASFLLDLLNIGIASAGKELVRFRSTAYEFQNLGQTHRVDAPRDVIAADLSFFGVRPGGRDSA